MRCDTRPRLPWYGRRGLLPRSVAGSYACSTLTMACVKMMIGFFLRFLDLDFDAIIHDLHELSLVRFGSQNRVDDDLFLAELMQENNIGCHGCLLDALRVDRLMLRSAASVS